jgi:hypothetical protein
MRYVKDIIRIIVALALVFALMLFQTALFIDHVVFNADTYSQYLNQPTYFTLLTDQIDTSLTQMATLYNIPASTLTDPLDDESIRSYGQKAMEDYIAYLRGDVGQFSTTYDTTALNESVESYVRNYAAKTGTDYQTVYSDTVKSIVSQAQDTVQGLVLVVDPQLVMSTGVGSRIAKMVSRLPVIEIVSFIAIVVFALILWFLNKHHRMRTIWWGGSSLLVSSIMMLIPGIYLQVTNVASGFGLQSESVQWITQRCISSMITRWNAMEAILLIVSILMMVFYVLNRKRRKEAEKHRRHIKRMQARENGQRDEEDIAAM